jgi:haloalkane dehalogenase
MANKRKNSGRADSGLYPFESRYITIDGHRLHYIEEGNGDPVVMLHGNPSWSFYYRNLIRRLSPFYHCIVPDHIGMGYSDKPRDDKYNYTLSQRVMDLEEFLAAKGINRNITLIMHDWGGIIGMSFACRHPQSIKKVVVLNTAAFHFPEGKKIPLFLRFTRTIPGEFLLRAFNSFSIGATHVGVQRKVLPRKVRMAYTAPYNSWKNRIGILRFVQDIPLKKNHPAYDLVTEVQNNLHLFSNRPVLIVWGVKDKIFDKDFLDKWISYFPQATVYRFEDCGHYVLEDAQEEIGNLVVDFLAK